MDFIPTDAGDTGNAGDGGGKPLPAAIRPRWHPKAMIYTVLVMAPVAAFLWIVLSGASMPAAVGIAAAPGAAAAAAPAYLNLSLLLAQITVIIAVARVLGILLKRLGQPQVVGEMIAGLALGPSLLGWVWPDASAWLFPAGTVRYIGVLSQLGIVLFMFLVGLELDLSSLRARGRHILIISHGGMALPMLGGGLLALLLYHDYSTAKTSFMGFSLFLGCAMSVTAFPVLARIIAERGLGATSLGATAMACAAVADVSAWALLAVSVSLERGTGGVCAILLRMGLGAAAFLGVMFFGVRHLLAWYWRKAGTDGKGFNTNGFSLILLVVLLAALATELLNAHAIFGAFVAGVAMPRDAKLGAAIKARMEDLLVVLLLPLFFAFTGLRTNVGLLSTSRDWWLAGLILAVAVAGKLGGSALGARASGICWREAGALGVLMNARGLMELVLLTIGLQDGVITPALFAMMVIMAVVTTMITSPVLARLVPVPALRGHAPPE